MAAVAPPLVPREVDYIPTEKLMTMTPTHLRSMVMRSGALSPKKGPWTPEESQRLVTLVRLMGPQDWVSIASFMSSRNAKQCRERYHQNLDPSLRHDPISEDEARAIMDLYGRYGTAWARIAEHLPGRSDNAIKNYVNGLVNKTKRAEGRHHHNARRRGSRQSIRSDVSSTTTNSATAVTPVNVVCALIRSPPPANALESPTFSDIADSDGGNNNYRLSSASPWEHFAEPAAAPHHSPPVWYRPLAQPSDSPQPLSRRAAPHPHTPYEASPIRQSGFGYVQHDERWRPLSRSPEPSSFTPSTSQRYGSDLARYSLSGAASQELTRGLGMQNNQLPRIDPHWARNEVLPALDLSAATGRADPRMAIANLLE
ncbi:hypothetical protein CCMA1212_002448 [Trichoderma ghanense]|uniref:Myb-like DNA-binding protein FlbD n=2 Tax=Trichoderma TaxID=5543 RepID=A0ABY2HAA1_9HYPO